MNGRLDKQHRKFSHAVANKVPSKEYARATTAFSWQAIFVFRHFISSSTSSIRNLSPSVDVNEDCLLSPICEALYTIFGSSCDRSSLLLATKILSSSNRTRKLHKLTEVKVAMYARHSRQTNLLHRKCRV